MFDEYQNKAIFCNEDKVLLVASPGSGKTTVIIEKLIKLIGEGVNGDNILLITFTRKACENMKSRFIKKVSTSTLPNFYTFHGLFYKIVKENIKSDIDIIDESLIEEFLKNCLKKYVDVVTEYKIKSVICELNRFNSSNKSIEDFDTSLSKDFLSYIVKEYKKFKLKNELFDFNDLAIEVLNLFDKREDILNLYREKFKYILVDEFQDCDDIQFKILKMLSENSKLFCVGDEDQSIYQFRGANPSIMVNFCKIFKNSKKYYLKYNYRSKYSIIDFSRNVILNNKIRNEKQLIGKKIEEGEVICKKFLEDTEQGTYIVNDIECIMKNGGELSDFAVLYRNHSDSFSVLSEFIKRNIKINFLDSNFNIFEQFYIKDIINLLLFIDECTINNFEKIYNKITFIFSRKIINIIKKYDYNADVFSVVNSNIDKLSTSDKRSIYNLEKIIIRLKKYPLESKIKGVLNKLGYLTYINNIITSKSLDGEEVKYFIKYFYNLMFKFNSIGEFDKSVSSINSIHGVNFGTIHSSKGMEFKCVYIINAQKFKDQVTNSNINVFYDEEEERRIFYVGITRAIDRLRILSPYFINGKFNDEPLKFIGEGLMNFRYGKFGINENDKIKKISKNKVLFYNNGKKKRMNTKDYLNIT